MARRSFIRVLILFATVFAFRGIMRAADLEPRYTLKNRFGLSLSVRPKNGDYALQFHGQPWFGTGVVSALVNQRWYRSGSPQFYTAIEGDRPTGKLLVEDAKTGSGRDEGGTYQFVDLYWKLPENGARLVTGFRMYDDNPYLVFVQKFPDGFKNYASGDWTVPSVAFPQFVPLFGIPITGEETSGLYSWTSTGMWDHRMGRGNIASIAGTVDILLVSDRSLRTVVLSPFANYLTATQQSTPLGTKGAIAKGSINCGIEGLVKDLPAGTEHKHILVAGQGIHDTFSKWGQALLVKAGKRIPSKYYDDVMKYFVYMDDYGSYYREHGFKEEGYQSYADIMLGVEADARKHDLRIGTYFPLDADQILWQQGLFEGRKDLFPEGVPAFQKKLGKPLQCYYIWMSSPSPYRKDFAYIDAGRGMGDVFYTLDYWRYTANKIASWGAIALQHDFLSNYEGNKVMMSSIDKMDTYFKNMRKALQEKGMSIHYCMCLPRNILESTENPIMVSLQGSDDHHIGMVEPKQHHDDRVDPFNWKQLMFNAAFYGSVGIWPSRDNIQTLADPNGFEDFLLANLQGGSMELGHRIGECNLELVKKAYREGDELILKPDRPIAPIDRCYLEDCSVGYTESNISGKRWYYVVSLPEAGYTQSFTASDLGGKGQWVIYNQDTRTALLRDAASAVPLIREAKHEYFVVAPVLGGGMAVLGDVDKFVSMADQRIASVDVNGNSVKVGVISSAATSPIITGYAADRPASAITESAPLEEVSSLGRLKRSSSGWFWDPLTRLWHVKVSFEGARTMEPRSFTLTRGASQTE